MDDCKGYEAAGPILSASKVGCPAGPGLTSELTSDLDPGSRRAADRGRGRILPEEPPVPLPHFEQELSTHSLQRGFIRYHGERTPVIIFTCVPVTSGRGSQPAIEQICSQGIPMKASSVMA